MSFINNNFQVYGCVDSIKEYFPGKAAIIVLAVDDKHSSKSVTFVKVKCYTPACYTMLEAGMRVAISGYVSPCKHEIDGHIVADYDLVSDNISIMTSAPFKETFNSNIPDFVIDKVSSIDDIRDFCKDHYTERTCSVLFSDSNEDLLNLAAYTAIKYDESHSSPIYKHVMNVIDSNKKLDVESLVSDLNAANEAYDRRKNLPKKNKSHIKQTNINVGVTFINDLQEGLGE